MAKLDRTQPFGEVQGALEDGTRYFQGDKRFDINGDEIGAKKPQEKHVKPKKVPE